MRKFQKMISLPAMLLLVLTLTGCGSAASSGNTGIWIAVTVMVFIAVFSATSGVVYLVLQKLLPPEKPRARSRRTEDYDYDDLEPAKSAPPRPAPNPQVRPVPNPQSRPAVNTNGGSGSGDVWLCPRDGSRNFGPYCAVCGTNRPVAPRTAAADLPQSGQSRPTPRAESGIRQPGAFTARMQEQPYQKPAAQPRQPVAEKEYRGKFARREPAETTVEEPEVDSELLAAIFREAAENPEE